LLRNIDQELLDIIKKKEIKFIKRIDIISNYNLYYVDIKKKDKKYLDISYKKYLDIFYKNNKILKLILILLRSKFIYKNNFNTFSKLKINIFLYYF